MIDIATSDRDFYQRKIIRLETDLAGLQDQLNSARLRLRTAEDYQIKYDLLLRQSQHQNQRLKYLQRTQQLKKEDLLQSRIRQNDLKWEKILQDKEKQLRNQYHQNIQTLQKQIKQFNRKLIENNQKIAQNDLLQFKIKKLTTQKKNLEQQADQLKIIYENQRQQQINNFKQYTLMQNKQKHQIQKSNLNQKIQYLEQQLAKTQDDLVFYKIQNKTEQKSQQLVKIKEQIQKSNQNFKNELDSLKNELISKNKQIQGLINERVVLEEKVQLQKKQLWEQNQILMKKVFEKQKQHEIQLINLKERMTKIREEELQQIKSQQRKSEETFQEQRASWTQIIDQKQEQTHKVRNRFEEQANKFHEDKQKMRKKIQELKQRLKQLQGQKDLGETQQLLLSLREMENKQDHFESYQNGIVFLQLIVQKLQTKLKQKHLQNRKLLEDKGSLMEEHNKELQQIRQKIKKQKKQLIERIINLQQQNRQLNQKLRQKDRQIKKIQKDQSNKRNSIQIQNRGLKQITKEWQNDYNKLKNNKNNIEKSFREERQKALGSKSQIMNIQRQKWIQKQKLKNDLQVIYQQKIQQIKIQHQMQRQKLRLQRDKLKQQNQILNQRSQLQSQQLNILKKKVSQDFETNKISEYNKKMATLNLQIALTQNIYKSLVSAKSRIKDTGTILELKSEQSGSIPEINLQNQEKTPKYDQTVEFHPIERQLELCDTFGPNHLKK